MAKKILIFIAGIVTGAILMVLIAVCIAKINSPEIGISLYETEGVCVSDNSFKILQVLDSGDALAVEIEPGISVPTGVTVLFLHDSNKSFYDEQIIQMPTGKCAKQIGVFKYKSNAGMDRTVPIVDIRDK